MCTDGNDNNTRDFQGNSQEIPLQSTMYFVADMSVYAYDIMYVHFNCRLTSEMQ